MASFDAAIAIRADYALAHANRGTVLTALGRPHDALASFEHALALAPDFPEAYVGRGNAFKELNQLQPALESYDRAVALRADFAEAHFNRAIVLLLLGDLEAGWQAYEWRWRKPGGSAGKPRRDLPQPLWLGAESLEAKTLLIHCEKGLGDTLQFCRYVRLAAERRARVILQVQAPLVELLSGLDGAAQVLSEESSPSGFDYHCPLLSLPLAFGTRLENIPAPARYLSGDAGRSAEWRRRLGDTAPRIGLVWRGDPTNPDDRNRSVALQDMLPHLSPGARYFSLQKALTEAERRAFESNPDLSIAAAELSFADAAAVCECLDLVISVDTSIAHLSAALGRPTWILLPFSPDCRWLLGRDDSPWYPSVKLYRQARSGDWCDVLARVGADLTQAFPRGEGVSALRPPPG